MLKKSTSFVGHPLPGKPVASLILQRIEVQWVQLSEAQRTERRTPSPPRSLRGHPLHSWSNGSRDGLFEHPATLLVRPLYSAALYFQGARWLLNGLLCWFGFDDEDLFRIGVGHEPLIHPATEDPENSLRCDKNRHSIPVRARNLHVREEVL